MTGAARPPRFDALDCLAAITFHIPDQREQKVHYYGFLVTFLGDCIKKKNRMLRFPLTIYGDPFRAASSSGGTAYLVQTVIVNTNKR